MFDDEDYLKQKFRDFLKDEFEELQQHKLRFLALFFSLLLSMALLFMDDGAETVEVSNTSHIEEISDDTAEENAKTDKKTSDKTVISVKKDSTESKREKVVAVLGATNSDKLYIGDPFQSEEDLPSEVQQNPVEIASIPQQVPIIPPQLPPIPDQIQNLPPIPSVVPQITETAVEPIKTVEQEFILTGTAINFDKKSAVVQKISTAQGQNARVENLILNVGDSLDGHQIVDITPSAVFFDDGHRINSNYLRSDVSIVTDKTDVEIEDTPTKYTEISINPVSISDSDIPVIPDGVDEYNEELPDENDFKISDVEVETDVPVENVQNIIQVNDENLDLNSSITDKLTDNDKNATNIEIEIPVDSDIDTSENNIDLPFNVQADSFASGNNSP